ncbi:3-deoxy-7-phosphoheptulonate synthase [Paenibacillus sp. KS-LC4]|uniref:3-deoxy-7-phosphoheptulonate synthase n=1 Tax=Paenibacillus sp. KS-LC4 TaxID=2979727 RepID=UPI0030CE219D
MIIHVKKGVSAELLEKMAVFYEAIQITNEDHIKLVTPSKVKTLEDQFADLVDDYYVLSDDIQLASKQYKSARAIQVGDLTIGGNSKNTIVISGPCSVESRELIEHSAAFLKDSGIKIMRAGSFKPRTSPYTFQGLGSKGLELLTEMKEKYGLKIITEARDATHIDEIIEAADIVQIGAKAMYDQGILRKCAKSNKPVLIKRGFGSTLQEFVQAAEFVLSGGNEQVILCERGIRTFESKTRFTLDLCGVSYLKEYTNLPIVVDPSHAMGYSYGVADLTRASVAMGVDGVLIEVHPNPKEALSDAAQQLNHNQFSEMLQTLKPIAESIGRNMI